MDQERNLGRFRSNYLNLLITGHKGYIGSLLFDKCKPLFKNVIGYDLKDGDDIRDLNRLNSVAKDASVIFHLASMSNSIECEQSPSEAVQHNIIGTENVATVAKTLNIPVIFASSVSVYGDCSYPISETFRGVPKGVYSSTKIRGEFSFKELAENGKATSLRIANVYGYNNHGQLGQGLIQKAILHYMNETPISLFNSGQSTRDYIHVEDVVDTFINVLYDMKFTSRRNKVINVASGSSHTTSEVVKTLYALLNTSYKSNFTLTKNKGHLIFLSENNNSITESKLRNNLLRVYGIYPRDLLTGLNELVNLINENERLGTS